MSATSTHDTKRSEDVRSRVHVISELSEEWTRLFDEWHRINAPLRSNGGTDGERSIPDLPTEYLVYETLIGAWPHDGKTNEEFLARMKQYFLKAAREGKSETSWIEPNPEYENRLMSFAERLLSPKTNREFRASFSAFAEKCAFFGAFNSLSLLALKSLSPGLPDFYQGCELWDLSLVDPDNRRPVDYDRRRRMLKEMKQSLRADPKKYRERIIKDWKSGEVKLWLTWEFLRLRKQDPELFTRGDYLSIEPLGEARRHFVAFMRLFEGRAAFVIVPRFLASTGVAPGKRLSIQDPVLLNTQFQLPTQAPLKWVNALTGRSVAGDPDSRIVAAGEILDGGPVGVLIAE